MKQVHIFDNDGVIVDSEMLAIEVMLEALAPYGYHSDPRTWGSRYSGMLTKDILASLEEEYGLKLAADFYENTRAKAQEKFQSELKAIKGMPDLIRSLPGKKAVVSNSKKDHVKSCLERAKLTEVFGAHTFSVDMVDRPKPHPDLYLLAVNTLQVDPQVCIVVEDSATGVTAARAAGLEVIGFMGAGHVSEGHELSLLEAGAKQVARDAAELKEMLHLLS